ncbi:MAG: T9SS type A sorting domain-containing protein [Flavobacteriales bacterium]
MTRTILLLTTLCTLALNVSAQKTSTTRVPHSTLVTSAAHAEGERGNAPPNDDCANAEVLTVTADCSNPLAGNNAEATQDGGMSPCEAPGTFIDVWYVFNPGSEDTVAVQLTPADPNAQDWSFGVYDACGGNELFCIVVPGAIQNVPVVPNTDNYIRVWSNTNYGPGGPFTLCVRSQVNIPVPANDVCDNVTPQALAIGGSLTLNGTNEGALNNENEGVPCVWEAFTTSTCADVHISYCGTDPVHSYCLLLIYTDCSFTNWRNPGSYALCADGNRDLCFSNLPAGTYYYPVGQIALGVGPYVLTITAEACGTNAPANDECSGAIPLSTNTSCITQTFSPSCASQSLSAVDCGGFIGNANDDVWYTFIATTTDMTVGGLPNGDMDIAMELFSGSCGSLTSVACGDIAGSGGADDLLASGLSIGSTYYLRVYDYRVQYAFTDPSYQLCVVEGLGSSVGVEESANAEEIALFPNPTNGDFSVRVDPNSASVTVCVIDATGRTILTRSEQRTTNGFLQVRAEGRLAPGLYTVRIGNGGSLRDSRLVVQ